MSTLPAGKSAPSGKKVAFFDVDETLITEKSMFTFMQYHYSRRYHISGKIRYLVFIFWIKFLARLGTSREAVNRIYYRTYRGTSIHHLDKLGREWFAERSKRPGFFISDITTELKGLQQSGYLVALVSGSFRPCLEPIAEQLNADFVLCTELENNEGTLSGRVLQQTIGKGKSRVVQELLRKLDANADDCTAYGDHISDLPMLELVGRPVVVGRRCSKLVSLAEQRGWAIRRVHA
ncbi:HAD family hydrolase [Paraburkholderia humisilvae]|uniref:Putative phosphatase n=1 Tax=Paraburkholderia humisilvae TaxID=627669 RepID=A0A6J5FAL6_9BURK|nr:HAD-IB family hydrolase [Paraburkholderia humisilvae]CAB3774507.1 putative phosphatase [Paraburkholderia humisilvae]